MVTPNIDALAATNLDSRFDTRQNVGRALNGRALNQLGRPQDGFP